MQAQTSISVENIWDHPSDAQLRSYTRTRSVIRTQTNTFKRLDQVMKEQAELCTATRRRMPKAEGIRDVLRKLGVKVTIEEVQQSAARLGVLLPDFNTRW